MSQRHFKLLTSKLTFSIRLFPNPNLFFYLTISHHSIKYTVHLVTQVKTQEWFFLFFYPKLISNLLILPLNKAPDLLTFLHLDYCYPKANYHLIPGLTTRACPLPHLALFIPFSFQQLKCSYITFYTITQLLKNLPMASYCT